MRVFVLFIMLFCHIVDDYYLQGILAKLKQKDLWQKDPLYKHDYKVALIEHGFSWTFMIMLPVMLWMIFTNNFLVGLYCSAFVINWIIHTWIDHLKCNVKNCSLLVDQIIHICQVVCTWSVMYGTIK